MNILINPCYVNGKKEFSFFFDTKELLSKDQRDSLIREVLQKAAIKHYEKKYGKRYNPGPFYNNATTWSTYSFTGSQTGQYYYTM